MRLEVVFVPCKGGYFRVNGEYFGRWVLVGGLSVLVFFYEYLTVRSAHLPFGMILVGRSPDPPTLKSLPNPSEGGALPLA